MRAPLAALLLAALSCSSPAPRLSAPESRAISFLEREVRAWRPKNKCFSCHNNGDAARALFTARRRFDTEFVRETVEWLSHPERWKNNGPDEEFSDKKLAAIQFSFALSTARRHGFPGADDPLRTAADLVAAHQEADGSWSVDSGGLAGSPVTYGNVLATVVARDVLDRSGSRRWQPAIERATTWLQKRRPQRVFDAAALLFGSPPPDQAVHCLDVIAKAQSTDGGWGPYANSPSQVFDTALVLLGLSGRKGFGDSIQRGRRFLLDSQFDDGSWPETTRPPGGESYAQRISTTGWAVLALIATQE